MDAQFQKLTASSFLQCRCRYKGSTPEAQWPVQARFRVCASGFFQLKGLSKVLDVNLIHPKTSPKNVVSPCTARIRNLHPHFEGLQNQKMQPHLRDLHFLPVITMILHFVCKTEAIHQYRKHARPCAHTKFLKNACAVLSISGAEKEIGHNKTSALLDYFGLQWSCGTGG